MTKSTQLVPHWIIVNEDKGSIWDKPFLTENACMTVWKQYEQKFIKNGWKIDKRMTYREVDEGDLALDRLVASATNKD